MTISNIQKSRFTKILGVLVVLVALVIGFTFISFSPDSNVGSLSFGVLTAHAFGGDGGGDGGGGGAGGDGGGADGGYGGWGVDGYGCCGDVGTDGGTWVGDTPYSPGGATPPSTPSAPLCTLSASPTQINQGGSSTLTWTTTNATSVSIDHGVGGVALNGNTGVSPTVNTTYTLTATGPGGTVTCTAPITLITTPAPVCTLTASPNSFGAGGGTTTLTWTTSNVTNVSIDQGIGAVGLNGTRTASVTSNTTYTLTGTGPNGTVTCTAPVTVGTSSSLACTLSASPTTINKGGSSTLTWTTSNATSASINQSIGSVSLNGNRSVSPSSNTSYTLTATNGTDTVTCNASITVIPPSNPPCLINCGGGIDQPDVNLTSTPNEQPLAFITLSQVPYTGFGAGPFLTALFWLVLIAWSAVVAYLIIVKRYGMEQLQSFMGHFAPSAHTAGNTEEHIYVSDVPEVATYEKETVVEMFNAPTPTASEGRVQDAMTLNTEGGMPRIELKRTAVASAPVVPVASPVAEKFEALREENSHMKHVGKAVKDSAATLFIQWIIAGDREKVFDLLRGLREREHDVESFLSRVLCELDKVHCARLGESPVLPDEALVESTKHLSTKDIEALVEILSTGVDRTYKTSATAVKLAVIRALEYLEAQK